MLVCYTNVIHDVIQAKYLVLYICNNDAFNKKGDPNETDPLYTMNNQKKKFI